MLPFQLSGELGDILAYLAGQCCSGTLALKFASGWPLLMVSLRSLDLSVEFGEAGVAMLNRTVAIANPVRCRPHAILL
jgi:hypothetical protein